MNETFGERLSRKLDYRTLRITEHMLADDFANLPIEDIDIRHISEYQVSDRQINSATLIYYVLPLEVSGLYVAKIIKNTYGELGFVTQSELDEEIAKARKPLADNLFPQQPQRQDSLRNQLSDLIALANRAGMYDAADWVKQRLGD